MTRAASRMAGGQWSERILVTSADEVGTLARSFNAMAEDLATQDEQRRALIATVSHELRTPLAAQRAVLENLADGVVAPDERTSAPPWPRPSDCPTSSTTCSTSPASTAAPVGSPSRASTSPSC